MIRMIKNLPLLISCCLALSAFAQEQAVPSQDTEEQADEPTTATETKEENNSSSNTGLTITTDGVTTTSNSSQTVAYVCTLNGLQRRVEIDLLNAPDPVPCEVNYYKDNENPGAKTTLWSARNDSYYCENQAKAFIEKLESMNWTCSGS